MPRTPTKTKTAPIIKTSDSLRALTYDPAPPRLSIGNAMWLVTKWSSQAVGLSV